jgi:hypothetical protein
VKEWHLKTRQTIEKFPFKKETENNLPTILRKLISTYLVHHGYSSTAEAFAKSVGHVFEEELASIRNRQKIQRSVLEGNLDEAIELCYQLFPGILERNKNLLFALKVRQFIEMINNAHNNSNNNGLVDDSNTSTNSTDNSTNKLNSSDCSTNMLVDGNAELKQTSKKNGFDNGYVTYKNENANEEAMGMFILFE